MSKALQLTIPKPCHENWDMMTQVEKGKFCASCQKQVIDFTNMSDRELAAFFKKPTGSVCGRFYDDQLNKKLEIPKKRIPWLKYFFTIALPTMLASSKATAQGEVKKIIKSDKVITNKPEQITLGNALPKVKCSKSEIKKIAELIYVPPMLIKGDVEIIQTDETVTGKVVSDTGESIADVTIRAKGEKIATLTDTSGDFKINIPDTCKSITASCVGFSSVEVPIDKLRFSPLIIMTKELSGTLGMVVQTEVIKPQRVFLNSIQPIFKDTAFRNVKFYPNPVTSNSNITIQWSKPEAGDFEIQLMNQQAQIINRKTESLVEKINSVQFPLPTVAPGNYFLVLINHKTGKRITEKIIIQ